MYRDEFKKTPVFQNAPNREAFNEVALASGLTEDEASDEYDRLFRFGLGEEVVRSVKRSGANIIQNLSAFGRALTGGTDPGAIERFGAEAAAENFSSPGATPFSEEDGSFNWEVFKDPQTLIAGISEQAPVLGGQVGLGAAAGRLAGSLPLPPFLKGPVKAASQLGAFGVAGAAPEAGGQVLQGEALGLSPERLKEVALQNFAGVSALNLLPGGALFSRASALPKAVASGGLEGLTESAEEVLGEVTLDPGIGFGEAFQRARPAINQVAPIAFLTGGLLGGVSGSQAAPPPPSTTAGTAQPSQPSGLPEGDTTLTEGVEPIGGTVVNPDTGEPFIGRPAEPLLDLPLSNTEILDALDASDRLIDPLAAVLAGDPLKADILSRTGESPLTPSERRAIERAEELSRSPTPTVKTSDGQVFGLIRNDAGGVALLEETPVGARVIRQYENQAQGLAALTALEGRTAVPRETSAQPIDISAEEAALSAAQAQQEAIFEEQANPDLTPEQQEALRLRAQAADMEVELAREALSEKFLGVRVPGFPGEGTVDELAAVEELRGTIAGDVDAFREGIGSIMAPAHQAPYTRGVVVMDDQMAFVGTASETAPVPEAAFTDKVPARQQRIFFNAAPEHQQFIQSAIADLLELGMPRGLIADINVKIFNKDAPGANGMLAGFEPASRRLIVRDDIMELMSTFPDSRRLQGTLRYFLAHELWHGADFNRQRLSSANLAEAFNIPMQRPRPAHLNALIGGVNEEEFGAVIGELNQAYEKNLGGMQEFLSYPMARLGSVYDEGIPFHERLETAAWVQYEAFAQLGSLYTINPELVREHMPESFKVMEEIHNAIATAGSAEEVNNGVREVLSPAGAGGSAADVAAVGAVEDIGAGIRQRPAEPRAGPVRADGRPLDEFKAVALDEGGIQKRETTQSGEFRRNARGDFSGAPPGINSDEAHDDLVERQEALLEDDLAQAPESLYWYERSAEEIMTLTKGNRKRAEQFIRLTALYSQANNLGGNTTASIKSIDEYLKGNKAPLAGRFPNQTAPQIEAVLSAKTMDKSLPGVDDKIMSFYRNIRDAAFGSNLFDKESTVDRWMMRLFGYETENPSSAQYAFAKQLMIDIADSYNAKHGTNLLPRNIQAGLWVYARNSQLADKALESGKPFKLPPMQDFQTELRRATQLITWEALPSASLNTGIGNLTPAAQRKFTQQAFGLIANNKGDKLAEALGVPLYLGRQGLGAYEGKISPNVISGLVARKVPELRDGEIERFVDDAKESKRKLVYDREAANLYARAIQYIYRQDAVPWFRPDHTLSGKHAAHGRAFRFKKNITTAEVNRFKKRLEAELGPGSGFTKTGPRELVVINYRDQEGKPFLLSDRDFSAAMESLTESFDLADFGKFRAEGEYHEHNWKDDPEGQAIEGAIAAGGRSDLLPWLRDRRAAFDRLIEDTTGEELGDFLGIQQDPQTEVDRLAQSFQGPNRKLPENPAAYFNMPPGTVLVPVTRIKATRARPKGIQNANGFMYDALVGNSDKRKPISLVSDGEGNFILEDGNSTYANARANNWLFIPAQISGDTTGVPFASSSAPNAPNTQALDSGSQTSVRPVLSTGLSSFMSKETRIILPSKFTGPLATNRFAIEPPQDLNELNVTAPIIYHERSDVNEIINTFNRIRGQIVSDLQESTRILDVEVPAGRIKGRVRIDEKLADGKTPERISDYFGDRVILHSPGQFEPALSALKTGMTARGYEILEVDDFRASGKGGYRAIHVQIKHPGEKVSFEVQIIPDVSVVIQDVVTHKLYEDLRKLWSRAKRSDLSLAEIHRMSELEKQARLIWDRAWLEFNGVQESPLDAFIGVSQPGAAIHDQLPKYAASINLSRLSSPEEVKQLILEVSKREKGKIDAQRRGVQGWGETERLAESLGMTPKQFAKISKGTAFNAEQIEAARSLMEASAVDLRDKAILAAETESNSDQVALMEAYNRHAMIQSVYSGIATEAGRALNILRKQSRETKNLNELLESIGGKEKVDVLARLIAEAETVGELTKAVRDSYKPKLSDFILEAWINALLSGPQTHAVNTLSNTLIGEVSAVEHYIAAFIGKFHGGDKVTFREANAYAVGAIQGARDGLRLARTTFATEEPSDPNTKLEARKYRAISSENLPGGKAVDVAGRFIRIPGRALQAEDEFFKSMGRRRMLNALASRQALKEGLSGAEYTARFNELVQNPPPWMDKQARDRAAYLTFTNRLGEFGRSVQRLASAHPILRVVMPFIRTPTNIVKFAAARSPFGLLLGEVRQQVFGKDKVDRDVALARMIFGSSVGAYIATLTLQGLISGGGPDDPKRRAIMYASGWQPYSIKVGNEWVAYSRLEPLGMLFGISADMVELTRWMDEDEQANVAALITGSITKNLTSKTWLRGLSEALNALHDPDRYGANYIRNLVGTVVPTGVAQIARINDPMLRDSRSILDRINSRIPGRGGNITPKVDIWGQPIVLEGGVGPDILSPIYTSRLKGDPATQALINASHFPGGPTRKIGGVDLDQRQFYFYSQKAGELAHVYVSRIVASPRFQQLNRFAQKEILRKVFDKTRAVARVMTINEFPELRNSILTGKLDKIRALHGQ